MNELIEKSICDDGLPDKCLYFEYNNISQRVKLFRHPEAKILVQLSTKLQRMLGFETFPQNFDTITAREVIDIFDGEHYIFVYSNVLEHRIVASQMVPLLRILPVSATGDLHNVQTFQNLHYFKARKQVFTSLEIDLRSLTGEKIPFQRGQIILTLHFRKVE